MRDVSGTYKAFMNLGEDCKKGPALSPTGVIMPAIMVMKVLVKPMIEIMEM